MPEPLEDADLANGWLPVDYDPDAFDTAEATTAMRAPCRAAVAGGAGCRGIGDKADGRRLPVTVVEQIARDAGVTQWWIGKANREDVTWPVAELRQNAQGLGLLRKTKGTLARPLVPAPSQTIPASW